ncbi:MAG: hypothetical protein K1X54_14395, partial [Flavobacteriales bacterium]|nr:hypothetical protein [Flavobacteriales bacterium]
LLAKHFTLVLMAFEKICRNPNIVGHEGAVCCYASLIIGHETTMTTKKLRTKSNEGKVRTQEISSRKTSCWC